MLSTWGLHRPSSRSRKGSAPHPQCSDEAWPEHVLISVYRVPPRKGEPCANAHNTTWRAGAGQAKSPANSKQGEGLLALRRLEKIRELYPRKVTFGDLNVANGCVCHCGQREQSSKGREEGACWGGEQRGSLPQHGLRPGLSQRHRGLPCTARGSNSVAALLAQHWGLLWPEPGSAIRLPCVPGPPELSPSFPSAPSACNVLPCPCPCPGPW